MASPTSVNSEITDSLSETNTVTIGASPSVAMGNLFQATAQALSNAAHNATVAQQQGNILAQAVTTQGVNMLYAIKFS